MNTRRGEPKMQTMIPRPPRLDKRGQMRSGAGARPRRPRRAARGSPPARWCGHGTQESIRVLILTTFDHDAMRAGASGFLFKTVRPNQLAAAVRYIAAGDAPLAPDITRRLIEQFVRRPPPGTTVPPTLGELTPREVEVLRLVQRPSRTSSGRAQGTMAAAIR
jgi:hypothetical protein